MIKTITASFLLLGAIFTASISKAQTQKETDDKILTTYFAKNKIKANQTPSGVYYVISKKGNGDNAKSGQRLSMKYQGTFLDGKQFDANVNEKFELSGSPFTFSLGRGEVIRGWDEGLKFFNKGSIGTLYLPSQLAYGSMGNGRIPPNSVLVFNVEVVDLN